MLLPILGVLAVIVLFFLAVAPEIGDLRATIPYHDAMITLRVRLDRYRAFLGSAWIVCPELSRLRRVNRELLVAEDIEESAAWQHFEEVKNALCDAADAARAQRDAARDERDQTSETLGDEILAMREQAAQHVEDWNAAIDERDTAREALDAKDAEIRKKAKVQAPEIKFLHDQAKRRASQYYHLRDELEQQKEIARNQAETLRTTGAKLQKLQGETRKATDEAQALNIALAGALSREYQRDVAEQVQHARGTLDQVQEDTDAREHGIAALAVLAALWKSDARALWPPADVHAVGELLNESAEG